MEKHVKIELSLSEEQLQEITGGCAQCAADMAQVAWHQTFAKSYFTIAQKALQSGQSDRATLSTNLSSGHVQAGQTVWGTPFSRVPHNFLQSSGR